MDYLVHAIAYSDKAELQGRYADTSRENFRRTMEISCYSFVDVTRRAAELMTEGGSAITLTYLGAQRVTPNYNVMGVAKAALESSVRYLAAGIGDARAIFNYQKKNAPLRRTVDIGDVGKSALYLLSDLSSGVTGEIHYVDSGFNITSMPIIEELKRTDPEQA
jgi:enoyl-[acyl-carrier protein] reductase I